MRGKASYLLVKARWMKNRAHRASEDIQPIFIGGCSRSGTTLMRRILDEHPRICCGEETNFVGKPINRLPQRARAFGISEAKLDEMLRSSVSQVDFLLRFFEMFSNRVRKERWADKSPRNVLHVRWILEHFPGARFIHMVRDGRDVACSLRSHHERVHPDDWPSVATSARRWRHRIRSSAKFRGHPRYREVRYEALVTEPRRVLEDICEYLDENFHPDMLEDRREPRAPAAIASEAHFEARPGPGLRRREVWSAVFSQVPLLGPARRRALTGEGRSTPARRRTHPRVRRTVSRGHASP